MRVTDVQAPEGLSEADLWVPVKFTDSMGNTHDCEVEKSLHSGSVTIEDSDTGETHIVVRYLVKNEVVTKREREEAVRKKKPCPF